MRIACVVLAVALSRAAFGDVVCSVDFGSTAGAVRAINGLNHGPQTSGRVVGRNIEEFRGLHIPSVRLHDATLFSPGMHLVDVPAIFPIWNPKADANDPRNYFFDATDDYLKILREQCGVTQIVYRLGASIEHTKPRRYFAKCPDDFEQFAEVCAGIVRHYTKAAWANGFDAGVTHWEIWNEPNNVPEMWDKDYETFLKMYVTVAGRLRREFPDIRIGGPANGIAKPGNRLELLIDACKKNNVPLDFYSEHGYSGMPEVHAKRMRAMRATLDKAGFAKTEIHFNEWHYFPCSWKALWYPDTATKAIESPDGINGIVAAAHIVHALTVWQDAPVDMANFYSTVLPDFGLYDIYGNKRPTYYAFKLFGDFLAAAPVRVKADASDAKVTVLAARQADGSCRRVLVSAMKLAAGEVVRLALPGCGGTARIVSLEGKDGTASRMAEVADGTLEIVATGGSGVWLVEIADDYRYSWRGFMLDEARHFFGKDTVKFYLDRMAEMKLNVFHWHLSDDQGWRIDLKGMPELVKFGATRKSTPTYESDTSSDGKVYGPFFYTEDDVREIVAYARDRGIAVVPEIDMPGHVRALLAAHPEFSCEGETLAREPWCCFGICKDVLCAGNDEALAYYERILDRLMALFPGEFIHIGGDECPTDRWKKCPKCQARIAKLGLKDEVALQHWVTTRMVNYVTSKGRRAVGWDEIIAGGEPLPKGTVVQCWQCTEYGVNVAKAGYEVVMSPSSWTYFTFPEGLPGDPYRYRAWVKGKTLPAEKMRRFDPLAGVPDEFKKNVLGGECCLWSEYVYDRKELEYKTLHRMPSFAAALTDDKRTH